MHLTSFNPIKVLFYLGQSHQLLKNKVYLSILLRFYSIFFGINKHAVFKILSILLRFYSIYYIWKSYLPFSFLSILLRFYSIPWHNEVFVILNHSSLLIYNSRETVSNYLFKTYVKYRMCSINYRIFVLHMIVSQTLCKFKDTSYWTFPSIHPYI